jgi:hypothetical protein
MNNSTNAATQQNPTEMLYGTRIRLLPALEKTDTETTVPVLTEFIDRINESIAIAKDNHLAAKMIQTRQANRTRRPDPGYEAGDMVLLDSRNIRKRIKKTGKTAKFYRDISDRLKSQKHGRKRQPTSWNYQLTSSRYTRYSTPHKTTSPSCSQRSRLQSDSPIESLQDPCQ